MLTHLSRAFRNTPDCLAALLGYNLCMETEYLPLPRVSVYKLGAILLRLADFRQNSASAIPFVIEEADVKHFHGKSPVLSEMPFFLGLGACRSVLTRSMGNGEHADYGRHRDEPPADDVILVNINTTIRGTSQWTIWHDCSDKERIYRTNLTAGDSLVFVDYAVDHEVVTTSDSRIYSSGLYPVNPSVYC